MPRIIPDQYDQLVWTMSETSGNYHNTGQFLPNNSNTDLVITNTVVRTGSGILFPNAIQMPGTCGFPSGSTATRNNAIGANTFTFVPPITVSCWVNLRSYHTDQNQTIFAKEYRNPSLSSNSWVTPFNTWNIATTTTNGGGDWFVQTANSSGSSNTFTVTDFPIPLGQWSHIGFTIDSNLVIRLYLNGCQMVYYSGSSQVNFQQLTGLSYTDGTNGFGPYRVGAVQSTGSANKEEPNAQIQDIRIANTVRTFAYFQKVYAVGALPLLPGSYITTQYYKLRAWDTSCPTPTAVYWVDTQVSLTNAPSFPCSGPYTAPEVVDTWFV
jgi:hypothetical protein